MQKRLLLLPIAWTAFGLGEVLALRYLLSGIVDIAPTIPNDKPIGGSILPVLFWNGAALLAVLGTSLYALGLWKIDLATRKARTDLAALGTLMVSGFLVWYTPYALFTALLSLVYFLAVNVE